MSVPSSSRLPLQIMPHLRRLLLLVSILCLLPIVSCAPVSPAQGWTIADLRLLDPVDDTPTPSTDILAVYTRSTTFDMEIRVDLLDLQLTPDYRLCILLDTVPGGNPWDLSVDIPASGSPTVMPASSGLIPRVIRDPWLDTVTIRLNRWGLPQAFALQVESFLPGDSNPVDVTVLVRSDALPPVQRAPLVLEFWDAFTAATPAQGLRRWDGAHTGPRGERHGLKNILDNAAQYAIPVALLDLKSPASLAALDYMGFIPRIQNLYSQGLLILPDVAYAEPADISLKFSRRAAAGFALPASQFVYRAAATLPTGALAQFQQLDDSSHLLHAGGTRLIPLPPADANQATQDGPSIPVRQALMDAALSADPSDLVVLGGDLPSSTWGNENMAAPTFAWIAAHPWIQPMNGDNLLAFPVETAITENTSAAPESPLLEALRAAPHNPTTDSAWQTYFMLTSPTADEQIQALRQNYLGQVSELLVAARWVEHPVEQANCDRDLNGDGQPECVLSNQNYLAILDPDGGRLSNLFYMDRSGPTQIIAPSSQFTVGLSDPSEWKLELGEAADPGAIPGAFSDTTGTWIRYTPLVTPGGILFSSPDGSRIKTCLLMETGIAITYQVNAPVSTRIPLAVDPQAFYFGPTRYTGSLATGAWTWGLVDGIQVEVRSDAALSALSFTDSSMYLSQPENPDRSYPAGHYLPFPMSVVALDANGNFSVQITKSR